MRRTVLLTPIILLLLLAACQEQVTEPEFLSPADAPLLKKGGKPGGGGGGTPISGLDIGTLGGEWSDAEGVNDDGWIVGYSATASGAQQPFVWRNDGTPMQQLPLPDGFDPTDLSNQSIASAVNGSFMIAGTSYKPVPTGRTVLRWTSGDGGFSWDVEVLPLPDGIPIAADASPSSINEGGTIVGGVEELPVVWAAGAPPVLLRVPSRGHRCGADDINDHGVIVGMCFGDVNERIALVWADAYSNPLELPSLENSTRQFANSINNNGDIVGSAYGKKPARIPVIWRLDAATGSYSVERLGGLADAVSINDCDQVVDGRSSDVREADGTLKTLESVFSRGSSVGVDISNRGWVAGNSEEGGKNGRSRATLWKLPEGCW